MGGAISLHGMDRADSAFIRSIHPVKSAKSN